MIRYSSSQLRVTHKDIQIISYSPTSCLVQVQTHLTNRLLMRRYALVQKARDADVFGILVGTLGVGKYTPPLIILYSPTDVFQRPTFLCSAICALC